MNNRLRAWLEFGVRGLDKLQGALRVQNMLNASMAKAQGIQAGVNSTMENSRRNLERNVAAMRGHNAAMQNETREMHKRQISWLGMLRVMALFAINLQIIRSLTAPFTFFRDSAKEAANFQQSLAGVNALLRLSKKELDDFGLRARRVAADFGIAIGDVLDASKQIASSVDALNLGGLSEAAASLTIVRAAARGAVVDNSDLTDSLVALQVVLAALRIPVSQANEVMKILFATVDVGDTSFQQLGRNLGSVMSTISTILPKDPERQMAFLKEVFAMFSQLTQVFPTSEAETSLNRFFINFIKQSKGQREAIQEIQNLTGENLSLRNLTEIGPAKFMEGVRRAISMDSPLVMDIVAKGNVNELSDNQIAAAQQSLSAQLSGILAPNVRAMRALLVLLDQAQSEQVLEGFAESFSKFDEAQDEAMNNFIKQFDRVKAIWDSFKISLAMPFVEEGTGFFKNLADILNPIINTDEFQTSSAPQKVKMMLNGLTEAMNSWWTSGGNAKVNSFAQEFASSLLVFLEEGIFSNMDKIFALGEAVGRGLLVGLIQYVTNPKNLLDVFNNPTLPAMFIKKMTGAGAITSIGAAMLGQQAVRNAQDVPSGGDTGSVGGGAWSLLETGIQVVFAASMLKSGISMMGKSTPGSGHARRGPLGTPDVLNDEGRKVPGRPGSFGSAMRDIAFTGLGLGQLGQWAKKLPGAGRVANQASRVRGMLAGARSLLNGGMAARAGVFAALGYAGSFGVKEAANRFGGSEFESVPDMYRQIFTGKPSAMSQARGEAIGTAANAAGFETSLATAMQAEARLKELSGVHGFSNPFGSMPEGTRGIFGLPSGTNLSNERNQAQSTLDTTYGQIASVLNVPKELDWLIPGLVEVGLQNGIKTPKDMAAFLAGSIGIGAGESGLKNDKSTVVSDPARQDPNAWAAGVFQLNSAGQGAGLTKSQALDPQNQLSIGGGAIAKAFVGLRNQGMDPNDPAFFQMLALTSGHPTHAGSTAGLTQAQIDNVNRMKTRGFEGYVSLGSNDIYTSVANQGLSNGAKENTLRIEVAGDMNITVPNEDVADAILREAASSLEEYGMSSGGNRNGR